MHTGRGTIQKFPQLPDFQAVWTQHRDSDNTSPFVAHGARHSSRLEETERVWRLRNMMANAHKHCDEAKPIPPTQFTLPERIPRQQAVVANTSSWRFWGSSFNDFPNSGVCCFCCRCCSVCLVRLHKIPHYFLVVAFLDPCHSGPYITLYGLILNSRWLWSIVPTLAQFFRSHCTWPSSSFAGPFCKSLAHDGDTRRSSSFAGRLSPLRDFLNSGFTGFQYSAAACFNASRDTKSTCAPVGFFDCPRMYAVSFSVLRSRVPFFQSAGAFV